MAIEIPTYEAAVAAALARPLVLADFVPRALGSLCRGDDARWAVVDGDDVRLVGLVLDTCDSRDDVAELLPVGGDLAIGPTAIDALLDHAERAAAAGPRANLDVVVPPTAAAWRAPLAHRGYTVAYATIPMQRPPDPVAEDVGYAWEPVGPDTVRALWALVGVTFADLPGAMMAPLEEFVVATLAGRPPSELLRVDGQIAAWVRVAETPDGAEIRSLGVHPTFQGRGLGGVALRRAIRLALAMTPAAITLEVAAINTRALRLYEGHGFVAGLGTEVWRRGLRG